MRVFFQIGANDGRDNFNLMVREESPDMVVLVEPNALMIKSLENSYKGVNNVHIFNRAIFYKDDEIVKLVIPASGGVYGTVASNGITYSDNHFSLLPMNGWGKMADMHTISAKTATFDSICDRLNIRDIEYLQIDTEGFDTEIIMMLDLAKYSIRKIMFEKWTFQPEEFTKFNSEIADRLGTNGIKMALDKLVNHGYRISDINGDFLAEKVPVA
jgi:FkbM family methyltransferase